MFKGHHFDRSVILLYVRWYLAYNLSLWNLEEMMTEGGISVDHASAQPDRSEILDCMRLEIQATSDGLHQLIDAGFGIAVEHAGVLLIEERVLDARVSSPLPSF